MNIIMIISITIIVLLLSILFLKLNIKIEVKQANKDFDAKITIQVISRFIKYTVKVPAFDLDEESPSVVVKEEGEGVGPEEEEKIKFSVNEFIRDVQQLQEFLERTIGFYKILHSFLAKAEISKFQWKTHLGLEEADKTGTGCGFVWIVKGTFIGLLAHYMRMVDEPKVQVVPHFQNLLVATSFQCMVSFRIGYAIHMGLKILRHREKNKRKKAK
ncbi:DUF2953 domain-containing protein [Salipaludibacillus sp. HK11]|uniref:DUF2953 domain-containing protein n=1 Tax=Salipaludibacillus sp. HK11 TaxID=3394320 RepID=UPI0039FBD789